MSFYKPITAGYKYELLNVEEPYKSTPQQLLFLKKGTADPDGELKTVHNGTTNEAVIGILIHRMRYQNAKLPSKKNKQAIEYLRKAMELLEKRTTIRKEAGSSTPLSSDVPHGTYLEKNNIFTVEELLAFSKKNPLSDLKWISKERSDEINGWIAHNL